MVNDNIIELLAPAGSAAIGRAAIDAGADAVYIGGELFSARAAAGNSIADIAELCRYARLFGARVYLALNTLLEGEGEIADARKLAHDAVAARVDAIIFQDVRLLDMDLPVEMHASTQTFNATAQRVAEMQNAGCRRVVLERALSIDEIRAIRASTTVELEAFIHGAICVGFSGVCALSEHLTGRSGNRGQCAQPCRSRYDLLDSQGRVLIANEALLSPRDMNLSSRIAELIDAGVCSLKIEGRLKDAPYVQNVVAHYDRILRKLGARRSSRGVVSHNFTPDLRLSFNRGFTEWFFDGVNSDKRSAASATPPGEPIGVVATIDDRSITIKLNKGITIQNGDGLCFRAGSQVEGIRVNRAEGNRLYLLSTEKISVGTELYRNSSVAFAPSSVRKIEIDITIDNQSITACDDYGNSATVELPAEREIATNADRAGEMLRNGMSKSGGTIFSVRSVEINCDEIPFMVASTINALRRQLLDQLEVKCSEKPIKTLNKTSSTGIANDKPDYLMRSRYCILREYGMCLKQTKLNLPLTLKNNNRSIALRFDCARCEMQLEKI